MDIILTKGADKQSQMAPRQVQRKLASWVLQVKLEGLEVTRRHPSWHDEPLKGPRLGQRSIRLNLQWRAIYQVIGHEVQLLILEVTPHDYRTR